MTGAKAMRSSRAGWTLLRFTWHDLTTRPAECLVEILDALALAAA